MTKGYILPITVIVGVIIMTTLGLWYQQAVVQSFLAERLIEQRGLIIECRSLIPIVKGKLDQLPAHELDREHKDFIIIKEEGIIRWRIDRTNKLFGKIRVTFRKGDDGSEVLKHTFYYRN